jgi:glycosyltransferase involved in cell wall biosynthesis
MSVYNSEIFFSKKIEDLLNQTIANQLEIIIVNSGSKENEHEIYNERYRKFLNIKYIHTTQRETIYQAWNRGIREASGKYITNANCDDRLCEFAYEKMVNLLDKNPDAALIYSNQYISNIPNENYFQLKKKIRQINPEYSRLKLLNRYIAGSQSMWRSSLHFIDGIWFDEKFEIAGDYDFICRVAEKYHILRTPEYLGVYYLSIEHTNKEHQNMARTKAEAISIIEKYTSRYLESANETELRKIYKLIKFYQLIPKFFFYIIREINRYLFPQREILDQYFVFYMASLLNEKKRNINKAKSYCKNYFNIPLMVYQYNRLNK